MRPTPVATVLSILLALGVLLPALASAQGVDPGGRAVVRINAIVHDDCEAGGLLEATVEIVRVISGPVIGYGRPIVIACADRAPVRVGAVLAGDFVPASVPRGAGLQLQPRGLAAPTTGDLPPIDVRALLGRTRADIERTHTLHAVRNGRSVYLSGFEVEYDGERAVAVLAAIPAGIDCTGVSAWLSLPPREGAAPLRRSDGCEWPGRSMRHTLAEGLTAALSGGHVRVALARP
jgi:hypothetical protein